MKTILILFKFLGSLSFLFTLGRIKSHKVYDQSKMSDMRFAAEPAFSCSAIKAELHFGLIIDLVR